MGASGKWLKSLVSSKKAQLEQENSGDKSKKKWRLWRSASEGCNSTMKGSKGSYVAPSEISESSSSFDDAALNAAMATLIRAPPKSFIAIKKEWAAIRIQTAFRAFLARQAFRALRAVVRIQAIFRGRQVRKQAAVTLRCMQALVRVQARVRAKSLHMSADKDHNQAQQGWCDRPGTLEQVKSKQQMRQEALIKRERAMAYSNCQKQSRFGVRSSHNRNRSDKKNTADFNWLERWMPWEDRNINGMEYGEGRATPSMTPLKSYEGVTVRRNNVTTKVSAAAPIGGEHSPSSSSTSASVSEESSHCYRPGYLNFTASAKAKLKASARWHQPIPFQTRSMALSETRSVADSTYYSQDLHQSERRDRFRTRHRVA